MENDRTKKCLICGGPLCWDNDYDLGDLRGDEEDDGGVVSMYHCIHCGRDYEIADPPKEERDTTYKEYWHERA